MATCQSYPTKHILSWMPPPLLACICRNWSVLKIFSKVTQGNEFSRLIVTYFAKDESGKASPVIERMKRLSRNAGVPVSLGLSVWKEPIDHRSPCPATPIPWHDNRNQDAKRYQSTSLHCDGFEVRSPRKPEEFHQKVWRRQNSLQQVQNCTTTYIRLRV